MQTENDFFDTIFEKFVEDAKNKSAVEWDSLFRQLKEKAQVDDSQRLFGFLKYFNIWNDADNGKGKIDFYADFIHTEAECGHDKEKITNDKGKIFIGENIFDTSALITIGHGFRNKKVFDEVYEFTLIHDAKLINKSEYFSKSQSQSSFSHSTHLNRLFDKSLPLGTEKEFDKEKYEAWLKALLKCYPTSDDNNKATHFFFLIGPVFFGSIEEEDLKRCVITANVGIRYDNINKQDKIKIRKFLRQLKIFINKLTFFIIIRLKEESLIKTAIRAALAQVMTRNLSHNIGSHVLIAVQQLIGKAQENLKNIGNTLSAEIQELKTLIDNEKIGDIKTLYDENLRKYQDTEFFKNKIYELWQTTLKFQLLIGEAKSDTELIDKYNTCFKDYFSGYGLISTLFNYLKVRFDFLADITTGTAVMESPQSVKDDIITCFVENGLLTNTISGIDKFRYKIVYKNATGDTETEDDLNISVPNDVLGNHAFYTILENIIRNAAKHGKSSDIDFVIKIEDATNCIGSRSVENDKLREEAAEMYAVSIIIKNNDGGEESDKATVHKLNETINKSVLEDNQLRQGGWGLLEMEASAAYLRKIPMEKIEDEEYVIKILNDDGSLNNSSLSEDKEHINILKAYIAKEDSKSHLAYRFFVYKPREVLIVGGCGITVNKKELTKQGINVIDNLEKDKVYPHKLILNCADNEIKPNPNITRRIVKNDKKGCDCSDIKKTKQFIRECTKSLGQGIESDNNLNHNSQNLRNDYFDKLKELKSSNSNLFCEIKMSSTEQWFNTSGWKPWNEAVQKIDRKINIMVVDERIQSFTQEKYKEIGNYTIFRYTNLFVPVKPNYPYDIYSGFEVEKCSDEVDLNQQNFDNNYQAIIKYIRNGSDMEFIVIHLGIIEKLIKSFKEKQYSTSKKEDIGNFIKEVICKKNGDEKGIDYDRIIIISGRGNPHNLPDDIRYLNFSIVNTYLTDKRNKYAFAEACYAARKKQQ